MSKIKQISKSELTDILNRPNGMVILTDRINEVIDAVNELSANRVSGVLPIEDTPTVMQQSSKDRNLGNF